MAKYDIMNKVEAGWITEIGKNTYVAANSIPVRAYRNNTVQKKPGIYVFCRIPSTENDIQQDIYQCRVEIKCYSYTPKDLQMQTLRELIDAVFETAIRSKENNYVDITQAGQITFTAIEFTEEHDEDYDDENQRASVNCITSIENIENLPT